MTGKRTKTEVARKRVLEFVVSRPGQSMKQISEELEIALSSVWTVLTQLEASGDVQARIDGAGRRKAKYYYPTGDAYKAQPAPAAVEAPPLTVSPMSLDATVKAFVEPLVSRIVDDVNTQVKAQLEARLAEALPAVMPAVSPKPVEPRVETKAKRRILIVGLLPQQAGLIQQEFHRELDLDFYQTTEHRNRLASKARHVDLVISMTKFIDHSVTETIRAAKANLRYCNGGLTALRDILTEEYANHD